MPDPIQLPKKLRAQWRIKIYDNERLEPPHVTLIGPSGRVWRIGLREKEFMVPPGGRWRDIDSEVRTILEGQWQTLCDAWDAKHPPNPVSNEEEEDGD